VALERRRWVRNFILGFLGRVMAVAVGVFGYLRLGLAEVRADLSPPRWENSLMYSAVHASVRRRATELTNPIKLTDENLIAGGRFYLDACAGCHGTPGKPERGGGPVLYPPIPELPVVGTEYSEAEIFWFTKHGVRRTGMFAHGKWVADEKL
jgi:mono/diheme cytochrome c family protein